MFAVHPRVRDITALLSVAVVTSLAPAVAATRYFAAAGQNLLPPVQDEKLSGLAGAFYGGALGHATSHASIDGVSGKAFSDGGSLPMPFHANAVSTIEYKLVDGNGTLLTDAQAAAVQLGFAISTTGFNRLVGVTSSASARFTAQVAGVGTVDHRIANWLRVIGPSGTITIGCTGQRGNCPQGSYETPSPLSFWLWHTAGATGTLFMEASVSAAASTDAEAEVDYGVSWTDLVYASDAWNSPLGIRIEGSGETYMARAVPVPVPEPGAGALLLLGLAALPLQLRRRSGPRERRP